MSASLLGKITAARCSVPAYVVSNRFVNSRLTAALRCRAEYGARSRRSSTQADEAPRRRPACAARDAVSSRRARRAADFAGKKPSKTNRSVGSPATDSAAIAAQGPGTTTTFTPRARASADQVETRVADQRRARVRYKRDRFAVRARRPMSAWLFCSLVVFVQRSERPVSRRTPATTACVCRVSSAAIRSTLASTSRARALRSPRLPIGVATTYRVPGPLKAVDCRL